MTIVDILSAYGIGIVAVLAFIVNVIVELTKNLGALKNVPTSAYTLLVSLFITGAAYGITSGYLQQPVLWYEAMLVAFGGFIVAYVAMYGWSKLREIWLRFKK